MFRQIIIIVALLITSGLAQAAEAGRIVFVTGQVQISARAAALGDAMQEGDELSTGADGYVYLKTVDNGFLILRPSSHARIVRYHVDTQTPANTRVKLELLSGVARTISGQAVKNARQNFRFNTPVAAIGVRGTDFTVFTNQETSRVAVISGGVVVSGFSGACGPDGGGPCEGSASRELFAHQEGQLLQIQKGQAAPQLLRNNALSPDVTAPPRKDEPASGKGSAGITKGAEDLSLDPQKNNLLVTNKLTVPAPAPVPVAPPPVVMPASPEISWGRWESVANLPADSELLAKLRNGSYEPGRIIGSFVVSRINNSELVLPKQGSAAFALMGGEAYVRSGMQQPVAAIVQDARLDVDFASRSFATSLNVVAPGAQVEVRAKGDITLKGELVSDLFRSNSAVQGYLGGADAREAAYIFTTTNNPNLTAFGATHWAR